MAQQSQTPLPVPRENERITVLTTGNFIGNQNLEHQVAAAGDQRPLYTEGISNCKVLATYTPGGSRTLLHANGGDITREYLESLARDYISPNTNVIVANGNGAGSPSFFEGEVADFGQQLNAYLQQYGKPAVTIVLSWEDIENINTTTFVLRHDGVYGRCDVGSAGVGGGRRKKWFCGLC